MSSSDDLAAGRWNTEPLPVFFAASRLGITLSEEFIERVAGALLRLHNQPAALKRGRNGQHD